MFGPVSLIPVAYAGRLSPKSKLAPSSIGKVPSVYNRLGEIVGFKDWTKHRATEAEIRKWKQQGCNVGLILGRDRGDGLAYLGIDVDTSNSGYQDIVADRLSTRCNTLLPYRGRDNSERRAYIILAPAVPKHVHKLPDENGKTAAIELLGTGQQIVVFGTHPSGGKYTWYPDPLIDEPCLPEPGMIPVLTAEQLKEFWRDLPDVLPVTDSFVAGAARQRDLSCIDPHATDDVADWLDEQGYTLSVSSDGSRNLRPFRDESEYSNGCSETSIKYFPAGTGGFQQGHFKSMHASDSGMTDTDWLEGYGYQTSMFEDLTVPDNGEKTQIVKTFTDINTDITGHFLERFIYVIEGDQVCDLSRPPYQCIMSMSAFKNLMAPYTRLHIGKKGKEEHIPASKVWIEHRDKQVAESTGYKPGAGRIIERHDGRFEINEFYMPEHPNTGDTSKLPGFLNHMHYLVPDAWQREFFIARLGWMVQRPERRCPISILHVATAHGTGRGWVSQLMERVLGPWNCSRTRMNILCKNEYHDYLYHTLLCTIDEVKENDRRYEVNDKIRDVLTEPRFEVNCKYGKKLTRDIYTGFLFYTNHFDALALPEEDRRIAVLGGPEFAASEEHYTSLYSALNDSDFIAQVYWYLMGVDLSRFNWQRAPETKERQLMIESNKSDVETVLVDILNNPPAPAMTYQQIVNAILAEAGVDVEINQKHITKLLREKTKRQPTDLVKIDGMGYRFWIFEKNRDFSNEELREIYKNCEILQSGL
ncbi:bifunctional DNA primase/polymerase [Salmonella enterica]|uniref:Bifunctional DNA primase/polymerase n=1 Tax=Salmonella enterica TaxID=28901 RepID=A0A5U2F3L6_SALER|nr:bifunctional DNA primase/polymerase [Salmonella enterica]